MSRNHLLYQSTHPTPRPTAPRTVWRMTLDVLGQAFGVRPDGPESRR